MKNPEPRLTVAALVKSAVHGKFLILERAAHKTIAPGEWECVSARVAPGESLGDAAVRAVRETVDMAVRPLHLLGTAHFRHGEASAGAERLVVYVLTEATHPQKVSVGEGHAERAWVSAGDGEAMFANGHWLLELLRRAEGEASATLGLSNIEHAPGASGPREAQ